MPSTTVHAGFALLLAAGLWRGVLDRRVVAVLLALVAFPEIDSAAGLWLDGAHRALLHNLTLPLLAGLWLYWDTRYRDSERSWLRGRWGQRGVTVAWVALFVHVFAHALLDYAHLEGINAFYPVYDRFLRLEGELALSTTDGIVQTFVDVDVGADGGEVTDVGATGTTADTHVANPVEPSDTVEEPDEPVERLFPVAESGWQLFLVLAGPFVLVARRFQKRRDEA
ncbi:LexA-binding, inner membrane-associated putative hydrolase [Halobiforma haloterrestris]|uniref:LexA-binding, inner membrane-associated putative hydrolase n=1 Tax=Natronobacterium haloterrestre TaxID=148448 RepID=A0A1I1EBD3_NATHA|nr:metal-dependent hydrolase [Halobiforma haloterrestris]SFB82320.1 LexA-binding, inner membrane-associated putative hydrolase [Halobiforma haloterrestris]